MKKEIAKIWVEALRSGKYEQTRGKLKMDESYCCLGVLCEISGLGKFSQKVRNGIISFVLPSGEICRSTLPDEVLDWADMSDSLGNFNDSDVYATLSLLNDNGKTFLEIADIIELNIENL